jgi:predicted RNase H-like HicB family nuclease
MLQIETEQEEDGRWIAEVAALPGVLVYGSNEDEARSKVKALALRVIADRIENNEPVQLLPSQPITVLRDASLARCSSA